MSTFDGIVPEFPEIQIDYFRKSPVRSAPLACFLSHVHSDHLQGLESFRAPFIYCSPATRELLLRIEKYPHRMNFQKGILESRRLHYKHLGKLLRPIPLNTPTEIELTPRKHVRVTLFDANHCAGAVMFLIEGAGKAILYTGDIRAESWWTNALARHPVLVPYTLGQKRLDKVYLDTTFAGASNPLREFPSKAEGLAELIRKVEAYPKETVFYFRAWTFGYEDVWVALSTALNSKVHLDQYQIGVYRALLNSSGINEAPALCGFQLGNMSVDGCLSDNEACRVHSCEPGLSCKATRDPDTVYITPIVNRTIDGTEIPEVGAGGGGGDLYQVHELELPDESALACLEKLCAQHIPNQKVLSQTREALSKAFRSSKKVLSLDQYGVQDDEISLEQLVTKLSRGNDQVNPNLPNTIRFPYSRHSSYSELCTLIAAFRPKDIHPCTVDTSSWSEDVSIRRLFGHLCSGEEFTHDVYMRMTLNMQYDEEHARKRARYEDVSTQSSQSSMGEEKQQAQSSVPHTIPGRARTKREEIKRAHRYLQDHADPVAMQIGPLPSSVPTNEEANSFSTIQDSQEEQEHISSQPDSFNDRMQSPNQSPQLESQQTDTLTLPISESVLAPSSPTDADSLLAESPTSGLRASGRQLITSRLRTRISAYLAAQDGSYSAWEDHSLVSASNHAEEEEEL
ncbi:DNA repair metallo-beta-lactamase [Penicillium odoratum]|uniref:DNA repair metallo-beta-lactamase n=1 Tax=Penicillium odoratum TaxID=1167516 RepID=UPI002548B0B6|nr:DNA repair metallo-beta-lactamase [Penicillium odoratum]KAJ5746615.1 DNA repair metallo-beta-lactamase [Penicillium odoratum]